jgi:hypothetical protein
VIGFQSTSLPNGSNFTWELKHGRLIFSLYIHRRYFFTLTDDFSPPPPRNDRSICIKSKERER